MLLKANGPLIEGTLKGGEDGRGAGGRKWCGKEMPLLYRITHVWIREAYRYRDPVREDACSNCR